jgi:hypothetical protein
MNNRRLTLLWDKSYTKTVLIFTFLTFLAFVGLYSGSMYPAFWIFFSMAVIFAYFILLNRYSVRWKNFRPSDFQKKLFWHSFGWRIGAGFLIAGVSVLVWNNPVYVGAVDADTYHRIALMVSEDFARGNFMEGFYKTHLESIDNSGPGTLYGLLYVFTGGYYAGSVIFGALLGAISVVYLYKTARMIWGETIARTSGLLFMHFPLALFYSTVPMKENFVMVLIIVITYIGTRSINGYSLKIIHVMSLIFCMVALFFFRSAVGFGFVILVPVTFLLNRYRGSLFVSIFIGIFASAVFFWLMYEIGEIEYFIGRAESASTVGQQRTAELIGNSNIEVVGLSILDLALAPIYIAVSVFAPFPSFVDVGTVFGTPFDDNYYNAPGRMIWNILSFFSIIGLWYAFRERLKQSMMVTGFSVGYLYILIVTVTFTRERFAYLGMPLFLILAAVGIYKTKDRRLWYLYLCGLGVAILLWNYLRLATRGMA